MKRKMLSMFFGVCVMSNIALANKIPLQIEDVSSGYSMMTKMFELMRIVIFLSALILIIDTVRRYKKLKKKADGEGTKMKYGFFIWNIVIIFILVFLFWGCGLLKPLSPQTICISLIRS